MNKKILLIVVVIAVIVVIAGIFIYSPQETVTPINNEETSQQMVGNDRDAHGCIGSAGYSWCEVKNKCLRVWEEKCE